MTVELSTGLSPDPAVVAASLAGTRNVMRWAGMLDGDPEPIEGIRVINPGFPVRRCRTPRVQESCVVLHRVAAGDWVQAGDPVAEVRDAWGRPLGEGVIRTEYDGFVVGRSHGIYYYPGDPILVMAIADTADAIAPYPAGYFD
jgi:predicted deacylase